MQANQLLASRRPAQHVATHCPQVLPRAFQSCRRSFPETTQLHNLGQQRCSSVTKRFLTSNRPRSHNLQNVKGFTGKQPISIWRSTSNNPYENLAIENYLLKNSDPSSRILFTYINWPCVVIGRNQNPWLECNLLRMQQGLPYHRLSDDPTDDYRGRFSNSERPGDTRLFPLDLVRRRSGGGTVIHDAGNLNFSFIVPNDKDFTRDTHGHLVVTTLEQLWSEWQATALYSTVRVNERHDIVMKKRSSLEHDTLGEFKVSGSAFKLTRGRALHHGTILHSSPNIVEPRNSVRKERSIFSEILSSPSRPYLDAKGVGSVRSPVHNLFRAENESERLKYGEHIRDALQESFQASHELNNIEVQQVGRRDCTEDSNPQIFNDVQELMTDDWRFCQTPSFEYTSIPINGNKLHFQVKHGIIGKPAMRDTSGAILVKGFDSLAKLEGKKLHEIGDWSEVCLPSDGDSVPLRSHLATVFPKIELAMQNPQESNKKTSKPEVETKKNEQEGVIVIARRSANNRVEIEKEGENLIVEK